LHERCSRKTNIAQCDLFDRLRCTSPQQHPFTERFQFSGHTPLEHLKCSHVDHFSNFFSQIDYVLYPSSWITCVLLLGPLSNFSSVERYIFVSTWITWSLGPLTNFSSERVSSVSHLDHVRPTGPPSNFPSVSFSFVPSWIKCVPLDHLRTSFRTFSLSSLLGSSASHRTTYELFSERFLFCPFLGQCVPLDHLRTSFRTSLICVPLGSRASHWTTYELFIRTFLFCDPSWVTCVPLDHLQTSHRNVFLVCPFWITCVPLDHFRSSSSERSFLMSFFLDHVRPLDHYRTFSS
jgi:hypothetical protein